MTKKRQRPSPSAPPLRAVDKRRMVVQPECLEDLRHWVATDRKIALKVIDMMDTVLRDPFTGIGKPEPLKYLGPDIWSRRITQGDRLIYRVHRDTVDFLMARYHY